MNHMVLLDSTALPHLVGMTAAALELTTIPTKVMPRGAEWLCSAPITLNNAMCGGFQGHNVINCSNTAPHAGSGVLAHWE
jgi:hypothetical protein